jgi:hypothetical protein
MLARLSEVLYWAGWLLAVLLVAAAIAYYNFGDINRDELQSLLPSLLLSG